MAVAISAAEERNAFSQPLAGLPFEQRLTFAVGQALFERLWVAAPASTRSADGLGPLYNARSCSGCHVRNGRGQPPLPDSAARSTVSLVAKLGIPADDHTGSSQTGAATIPEPTYGAQIQTLGTPGQTVEGLLRVDYEPVPIVLDDGERIELRRPRYRIADLGFGPLHPAMMLSPRLTPAIVGMGLLARIPEADILAAADPDDLDGDGISGRPNFVGSENDGSALLGRFGWKAAEPTLERQAAMALSLDIGISSPLQPDGHGDCTARQTACRAAPTGNTPQFGNVEAPDSVMQALLFYLDNLGPPPRRGADDPDIRNGERLFAETSCTACHRPRFVTAADSQQPWLSSQEIHPYTDLLLHDMGDRLADGRPEGEADGREWRTPPLWGIGRSEAVNGHAFYLHDGRARSLIEAILWHGGEAATAQRRFVALPADERQDLLRFLGSL
ncbi:MAG: di-heme oxidoredictase family protein [Dongiaceae bacterium]